METAEQIQKWVTRAIIVVSLLTLLGLGLLWPRGEAPDLGNQPSEFVDATVTKAVRTTCDAIEANALAGCQEV